MGWQDVWRVAMAVFVAEPVELRILIGLGLVFLALMIVVGLKHAFRSAEPQPERRAPEVSHKPIPHFAAPLAMAAVVPGSEKSRQQPFRVSGSSVRAPRKSVKQTIKPFAPPRPKIHRGGVVQVGRHPHVTDEHAPFSPLPPHG